MKKVIAILTLISVGALVGCNTVAGAGKDIERGGEKVQEKANEAK